MVQEIHIDYWCDVCAGMERTVKGETVTIPAVLHLPAFELEVCPEHRHALADVLADWAELGRKPEARKRADQMTGKKTECPTCGFVASTQAQLRAHLRKHHDQSLADVGLEAANFTCPACGSKFGAGQGFAAHLRSQHGLTMEQAREAS